MTCRPTNLLTLLFAFALGTAACASGDDVGGGGGGRSGSGGRGGKSGSGGAAGLSNDGSSGVSPGAGGSAAGTGGNTGGLGGSQGGTDGFDGGTDASGNGNGGVDSATSGGAAGADAAGADSGNGATAGVDSSAGTAGVDSGGGTAGVDSSAGTAGVDSSAGTAGADSGMAGIDSGSSGAAGSDSGTAGTAGLDAGSDGTAGSPNTNPGYVDTSPPLGPPLDPAGGTTLTPPPPAGWTWYPIQGAICRDGSPAGMFVRFTSSDKLFVYLEGGGACTNFGFCNFNPATVNRAIAGTGETVLGSTLGVVDARQQPGVFELGALNGIFDTTNAANPFKDWNAVYIPYCTGDVHGGTRTNAMVPGVTAPQQFVGHFNMQKFIGRIVPTFKDKVNRVIITGASAGSFGAALSFSMLQDAFGSVRVDALLDSGVPFSDQYMPVCMQKRWRDAWGLNNAMPPDCTECRRADGGDVLKLSDFLIKKHPNATIALVSSMQDEVIRLFFSMGLKDCSTYDTADPVGITIGQVLDPTIYFSASQYTAGLNDVRAQYIGTSRFATYFLGGPNITFHQHIWRARFTDPAAGTPTIAQFVTNFLNGQINQVGP